MKRNQRSDTFYSSRKNSRLLIGGVLLFCTLTTSLSAQQLTLEKAIDTALKNNFDIRISRNQADIDLANNTLGNAGMLPTLALNGSVTTSLNSGYQEFFSGGDTTTSSLSYTARGGMALSWTLYDGGKMFVTRKKLLETEKQGEYQFRETVQQTLFDVVAAYYDIVRLKQQLRSVNQTIRYNQERVTIAQTGFNTGSLSKTDLLQAKIDLNEAKETAINQEFTLREAFRALNLLLARDAEMPFEVNDSIPNISIPDKQLLITKLNTSNTSLLTFQKQVEINRLTFQETKSNYLPRFDLSAGFYLSQTYNSIAFAKLNRSIGPQIGGTLSIPIYQAGESKRLQKVAELNVKSAEADLENIRLRMNLALQNAFNDFENQRALLKIEEENNQIANEFLEISIQRLRLGQTTSLEVHQALEQFLFSNTRLINFRYGLKLAETKLKQLVAGL
jgi:outer membrane protein